VLEGALHGPARLHGEVVGRHQAPDAVLGVAQQLARLVEVVGCEQVQQPLRDAAGQLVQQAGAVVGVELGQQGAGLRVGELACSRSSRDSPLEVREHLGGDALGERPEEQRPVSGSSSLSDVDELRRDELLVRPVDRARDASFGPAAVTDVALDS
jgi:hypothetical protein